MVRKNIFSNRRFAIVLVCAFLILVSATSCFSGLRERVRERRERRAEKEAAASSAACRGVIPAIMKGYGAEGPYAMDIRTLKNPLWGGEPVSVFFPAGAGGPRPVIFFSHGFGASDWRRAYAPFIRHMVSRGYIVVYSPYETFGASIKERYRTLWEGFEVAVRRFGPKMDLSRVGFVGHSFGGGATPAMAYRGLDEKGWGRKGAFMYILAPWYSFQITPGELRKFPKRTVVVIQVYDRDKINDHRMAIDIYRSIGLPRDQKHFQVVRSEKIDGCDLVADHATPGRNPSLLLKQYTVFRMFDALTDYVFNGNERGERVISGMKVRAGNFHPLFDETNPEPQLPESHYRFPWNSDRNPRRSLEHWRNP